MPSGSLQTPLLIGIAGLGRMGLYHLERLGLRNDCQVVAVFDTDPSRTGQADAIGCRLYRSRHEFLDDDNVELVLIATPPATHAPLTNDALRAGKHVAVETPLCLTVNEADEMLEAAARAGRMLSVIHHRRWDADFRAAKAAADSGQIGRLSLARLISWSYGIGTPTDGTAGWRTDPQQGGGALFEVGAHCFDQLLQLAESEPQTVFARIPAGRTSENSEDAFTVIVQFRDGFSAEINVDRRSYVPLDTGWTLTGTKGGFRDFQLHSITDAGEIFVSPVERLPTQWDRFYDGIVAHLRLGGALPVTGEQGRGVIRLIEAARRSAACGRPVAFHAGTTIVSP